MIMKNFETTDEILDFAMDMERGSIRFYEGLAGRMEYPNMREVFKEFAKEEEGHLRNLQAVKDDRIFTCPASRIMDLKIGDYLVDVKPDPEMDYQDALILAMKKEKAAFKLYNDLLAIVEDENLKETFRCLGREEAKHKLRFEIEYDEHILKSS
jgi:rubrerythrin